jgi:hypothetical protein
MFVDGKSIRLRVQTEAIDPTAVDSTKPKSNPDHMHRFLLRN